MTDTHSSPVFHIEFESRQRIIERDLGPMMDIKDDHLNLLSENFKPELALSSKMVTLLVPEVHCLDNLSKCRILLDEPTADLCKRKIEVKPSISMLRRSQYMEHKRRRLERYRTQDRDELSLQQSSEGFFERLASKKYF